MSSLYDTIKNKSTFNEDSLMKRLVTRLKQRHGFKDNTSVEVEKANGSVYIKAKHKTIKATVVLADGHTKATHYRLITVEEGTSRKAAEPVKQKMNGSEIVEELKKKFPIASAEVIDASNNEHFKKTNQIGLKLYIADNTLPFTYQESLLKKGIKNGTFEIMFWVRFNSRTVLSDTSTFIFFPGNFIPLEMNDARWKQRFRQVHKRYGMEIKRELKHLLFN